MHIKTQTSLLWGSKNDVDDCFNRTLDILIPRAKPHHLELMIATHNNESLELAAQLTFQNRKQTSVSFAQLFGMNDKMSTSLYNRGLTVYKYVPYGSMQETFPYLLRRLYENCDILRYSI